MRTGTCTGTHGLSRSLDEVIFRPGNARSAYLADPDGHIVEFWTWDVRKGPAGAPQAVSEGVFGVPTG